MKNLTVDGEDFQYEVFSEFYEYGDEVYTEFYQGTEEVRQLQWKFWKGLKKVVQPKLVFTIHEDIESEDFTKAEMRAIIKKKIELLRRKQEIERGEII